MTLHYKNLDEKTRAFMAQEVELDISQSNLYLSKRFNDNGISIFPSLLREAVQNCDDGWLAHELSIHDCFNSFEERRKRHGGSSMVKVPITVSETFAEGEFNRFYCRGLCLRAIEEGVPKVIVYRGKHVEQPRPESQAMIGKRLSVKELLDDLRNYQGVEPALGLPPGPNSGLTISLP
jgi:hypothetical protein